MRASAIKPGDIVRASGMHALVIDRERGVLIVRSIGSHSTRRLKANEIEAHWRRSGRNGRLD